MPTSVTTRVQRDSLTEGYEEFAVASALVWRQCEDAGHVVAVRRLFLLESNASRRFFRRWTLIRLAKRRRHSWSHFGEVADDVRPLLVDLGQDVEDEGLHVKVQGLVVQEQFGQQTQVLTVDLHTDQRSTPSTSLLFFL